MSEKEVKIFLFDYNRLLFCYNLPSNTETPREKCLTFSADKTDKMHPSCVNKENRMTPNKRLPEKHRLILEER